MFGDHPHLDGVDPNPRQHMLRAGQIGSSPVIRAPREILTEHLILRQSVDERDKQALESHVLGDGEFELWAGSDTFSLVGCNYMDWWNDAEENDLKTKDLLLGEFSFEDDAGRSVSYTIFHLDGSWTIGFITLTLICSGADLSFYVFNEYRRRIYTLEAVRAVIDAYFSGALTHPIGTTVSTTILEGDFWTLRIAAKLGFTGPGINCEARDVLQSWEEEVGSVRYYAAAHEYFLTMDDFYAV